MVLRTISLEQTGCEQTAANKPPATIGGSCGDSDGEIFTCSGGLCDCPLADWLLLADLSASPLRAPLLRHFHMRHRPTAREFAIGRRAPRTLADSTFRQTGLLSTLVNINTTQERCARIPRRRSIAQCTYACSAVCTRHLRVNACLCYMHVQCSRPVMRTAHWPLPFSRPLVQRIRVVCAHVAIVGTCTHSFITHSHAAPARHLFARFFARFLIHTLFAAAHFSHPLLLPQLCFFDSEYTTFDIRVPLTKLKVRFYLI